MKTICQRAPKPQIMVVFLGVWRSRFRTLPKATEQSVKEKKMAKIKYGKALFFILQKMKGKSISPEILYILFY